MNKIYIGHCDICHGHECRITDETKKIIDERELRHKRKKEECRCHYQCGCNKNECNCYSLKPQDMGGEIQNILENIHVGVIGEDGKTVFWLSDIRDVIEKYCKDKLLQQKTILLKECFEAVGKDEYHARSKESVGYHKYEIRNNLRSEIRAIIKNLKETYDK